MRPPPLLVHLAVWGRVGSPVAEQSPGPAIPRETTLNPGRRAGAIEPSALDGCPAEKGGARGVMDGFSQRQKRQSEMTDRQEGEQRGRLSTVGLISTGLQV